MATGPKYTTTRYEANYHEQEAYANFKDLLERPARDALEILQDRSPVPKFIQTHANGSQARFLMARVNPSRTHLSDGANVNDVANGTMARKSETSIIVTEDVSLFTFMETLIKYAVEDDGG